MKMIHKGTKTLTMLSLSYVLLACATQTETAGLTGSAAGAGEQDAVAAQTSAAPSAQAPVANAAPAAEPIEAVPAAAEASAETAREPVVVIETRPSRTVAELVAQIHKDRRALYISSEGSYQFYIGGVLKAKYFPDGQKLVLQDMAAEQAQPCSYNIDGKLQTKAKGKAAASLSENCAGLVEKLNNYLPG